MQIWLVEMQKKIMISSIITFRYIPYAYGMYWNVIIEDIITLCMVPESHFENV